MVCLYTQLPSIILVVRDAVTGHNDNSGVNFPLSPYLVSHPRIE